MDGYTKCPNDLLRCPALYPVEKVAWLLIASNQPGFAITTRTACEALGITNKTWYRAVDSLARMGLIEAARNGAGKSNSYNAVLEPSKWNLERNEEPSQDVEKFHNSNVEKLHIKCGKITQPNVEKLHIQMCKNSTFPQEKESTKEKEYIKDQLKDQENNLDESVRDAHACVREDFKREVYASQIKREMIMKKFSIDEAGFLRLAEEILNDWDITDMPPERVNWHHFLNTFRIKHLQHATDNFRPATADDRRAAAQRLVATLIEDGRRAGG